MITNLLATVVTILVTNVTERVPMERQVVECPDHLQGCLVIHWGPETPIPNPTNKWIRTTVTERECLEFDFRGTRQRTFLSDRIVSDVEEQRALLKTEKWLAVVTNNIAGKILIGDRWVDPWPTSALTNITITEDWLATNYIFTNFSKAWR